MSQPAEPLDDAPLESSSSDGRVLQEIAAPNPLTIGSILTPDPIEAAEPQIQPITGSVPQSLHGARSPTRLSSASNPHVAHSIHSVRETPPIEATPSPAPSQTDLLSVLQQLGVTVTQKSVQVFLHFVLYCLYHCKYIT